MLDDGLALSNSLQHPLTLASFNSVACFALHIVGDAGGCREFAERLMQVSVRYDFPATRAVGAFMLGAACALEGDIAPALEQMEPSYEATFGYGFLGMLPGVIMADTLAGANRNKEALALVMRLLEGSRTPEEGVFVPELGRLRGELVLRQSAGNAPEAERHLGTAARRRAGSCCLSIESQDPGYPGCLRSKVDEKKRGPCSMVRTRTRWTNGKDPRSVSPASYGRSLADSLRTRRSAGESRLLDPKRICSIPLAI